MATDPHFTLASSSLPYFTDEFGDDGQPETALPHSAAASQRTFLPCRRPTRTSHASPVAFAIVFSGVEKVDQFAPRSDDLPKHVHTAWCPDRKESELLARSADEAESERDDRPVADVLFSRFVNARVCVTATAFLAICQLTFEGCRKRFFQAIIH